MHTFFVFQEGIYVKPDNWLYNVTSIDSVAPTPRHFDVHFAMGLEQYGDFILTLIVSICSLDSLFFT